LARGAQPLARLRGVGLAGGPGLDPQAALAAAVQDASRAKIPELFPAPQVWGHTFAAQMALDVAAALRTLPSQAPPLAIQSTDPSGRAAAVVVQRYP